MTRTVIEIHALHTVPASCINRDQNGSPKTMTFGGVERARVSSQSWKRAIREMFRDTLDTGKVGVRTKFVLKEVARKIVALDPSVSAEDAALKAQKVLEAGGVKLVAAKDSGKGLPDLDSDEKLVTEFLYFLSPGQLELLAEQALADNPLAKDIKAVFTARNSVDLALFGRMIASDPGYNVDAACQVAHALGVARNTAEFDFFTAMDDAKEEKGDSKGGGMMGTVEFNSATMYRYATIDVDALDANLGHAPGAAREAVEAFIAAFAKSMPSGKSNTFANKTLPDGMVVTLRDTQAVNASGAVLEPVTGNPVREAAEKIADHLARTEEVYELGNVATFVLAGSDSVKAFEALGESVNLSALTDAVGQLVETRLAAGSGAVAL